MEKLRRRRVPQYTRAVLTLEIKYGVNTHPAEIREQLKSCAHYLRDRGHLTGETPNSTDNHCTADDTKLITWRYILTIEKSNRLLISTESPPRRH